MSAEPEAELPQIVVAPPTPAVRRPSPAGPPPRFGLGHLLLVAFFCSAYLALLRFQSSDAPGAFGVAIVAFTMPIYGLGGMGLALFITRRVRRSSWPIEPGEWLLAIEGAWLVVGALRPYRFFFHGRIMGVAAVLMAIQCCLFAVPVFDRKLAGLWRGLFLVLAMIDALTAAMFAFAGEGPFRFDPDQFWWAAVVVRPLASATLASLAFGWDFKAGHRRGWLHWLGLLVFVMDRLSGIVFQFLDYWLG